MGIRRFAMTLLIGVMALLFVTVASAEDLSPPNVVRSDQITVDLTDVNRMEYRTSATRPVDLCPAGARCTDWVLLPGSEDIWVRGIQDGPDGFPTLRSDLPKRLPPVYPSSTPSTSPSTTPSVEGGSLDEELVVPTAPVLQLYDEPGLMACYSSLQECIDKMSSYCNTTYPLPPGSTAVSLRRITRYEEGRMCQFTCVDRNGWGHSVDCTPPPIKRIPNPGDVTLTPTTDPLSPLEAR